ncbi:MAG: hypothetical protein CSYNP_01858 [Syntrophus sp. SKADARSKE-3]|nr:hypothetical protein [Syntrophus sp. SKADARSKE-3]
MATIWITYSWDDNKNSDIDFIAQEIEAEGLKVKLDRWNIKAGIRLWDQIEEFIQSPGQCDAWLLVATQASLGSEPCREEYAYALDRALSTRGSGFPVIALFPATVDKSLIPAGIRTRLYVSLRDPDWKERIVASAEDRDVNVQRPQIAPYHLVLHQQSHSPLGIVIEVRPRAGSWSPFIMAIPIGEKDRVKPHIMHGAPGRVPSIGALFGAGEGVKDDWVYCFAQNEATPTMSYYIFCSEVPSKLRFGAEGGAQYIVEKPDPVGN